MRTKELLKLAQESHKKSPSVETKALVEHFELAYSQEINLQHKSENAREFLRLDFIKHLNEAGIKSGKICEIGGPYNSFAKQMPDFEFEYLSLYPDKKFDNIVVADATNCDYVEDEKYDAIFSVSVFEHISKPWQAGHHLTRMLKPGGICYHSAPFSYFYHGAPADFWRFTPDAMKVIFSELNPLKAEFFGKNRRRDNRGSESNAVDRDGGPEFAVDAFGGWRENWSTIFVGQKDADYLAQRFKNAKRQVAINGMKTLVDDRGMSEDDAAKKLRAILENYSISHDEELTQVAKGKGEKIPLKAIKEAWKTRGRNGIKVSYSRFVMSQKLGL